MAIMKPDTRSQMKNDDRIVLNGRKVFFGVGGQPLFIHQRVSFKVLDAIKGRKIIIA